MSTQKLLIILGVLVVIPCALFSIQYPASQSSSSSVSSGNLMEQTAAEDVVKNFGAQLQKVSLLSPTAADDISTNYGAYVTTGLIVKWQADTESAPGKQTSSPWPDRISINSTELQADGSYLIRGNVIEVTSNEIEHGGIAGIYPITVTVVRESDRWLISAFEKGAYSEIPHQQTITGTYSCMPHKGDGPHTAECALGIKEDGTGDYYSLDTRLASFDPTRLPTGTHLQVTGTVIPVEQLSSIQTYDITGVMSASKITNLSQE